MRIVAAADEHAEAMARLLVDGFADIAPNAWPAMEDARREVSECRAFVTLVALDDDELLGWIGGRPAYNGNVWELHPLVVRRERRRAGVGRALVAALEREVAARGGLTMWVGADDEMNLTSIGGIDLYPDPLEHLQAIVNLRGHPYAFYLACGFVLAGVLPDANGAGKPDIFLCKRVAS